MGEAEPTADDVPLRSVHTSNFPQLLAEAASSVLVTTYQAGKLVILRNDRGVLNTHFRSFRKPMGLAAAGGRLAIGTSAEIWEFHNVPAVGRRLDAAANPSPSGRGQGEGEADTGPDDGASRGASPRGPTSPPAPLRRGEGGGGGAALQGEGEAGTRVRPHPGPLPGGEGGGGSLPGGEEESRHDVVFMPRRSHTTGDVQIHEMAWVGDELWFVNTAFSCLAVRSDVDSFEPRWRPPFIGQLHPSDGCHLNGLAVRDGRVRYVTALGETNAPGGWRENKRSGGVLLDVESGETIVRGLSMPHSPRWYAGRLWLLESGNGSFGTVDLATGRYEAIAQLPGFTRGLAFLGPFALIGLSQVRESAVFSGIPLVERLEERTCGVWVVHIETGRTVAFVRFEDAVQEIFAVELLAGARFPDLVNHDPELIGTTYVLPEAALGDVPAELRG